MEGESEARRVYASGDVADRLGVSGQRVRQLAAVYEGVRGDLPRNRRGRVWPEAVVEELERAHAAVAEGRSGSVERALRAPESVAGDAQGAQTYLAASRGARGDTEALAAVVGELRRLSEAVEGMSFRLGELERENRELREAVGGGTGRELEAPEASKSPGPTDTPTGAPEGREASDTAVHGGARRPWWRRLIGG